MTRGSRPAALAAAVGLWVFLAGAAMGTAAGDDRQAEAERWFHRGLAAYQKGALDAARDAFTKVVQTPRAPKASAGYLMLGRTLFRRGEHEQALQTVRRLEQDYPQSRYLADAQVLAGDCRYRLRRYPEAAASYARALSLPGPVVVQASAAERLAALARDQLVGDAVVSKLREQVGADRLAEALLFGEGRWYQRLNWGSQSRALMRQYRTRYPSGRFAALLEGAAPARAAAAPAPAGPAKGPASARPAPESRRGDGARPRLGLLLPLSGVQRQVGEDLLAGAELANEERGSPVDLVGVDTGIERGDVPIAEGPAADLLRSVAGIRSLAADPQVLAVLGPVYSASVVAAGCVAVAEGVPLLAPLAQQAGLDTLGDWVFQLAVTPDAQGRALGEYATRVLGLRNLAVLAPLTDYGWGFAGQFAEAVASAGGRVAYQDWYVPGEQRDFRRLFEDLRRVGAVLAPPLPDSLVTADSTGVPADTSAAAAVSGIPATVVAGIEGLALVVESFSDARTILPQLFFYRVHTQILGNDVWGQADELRQLLPADREHFHGLIFTSRRLGPAPASRRFTGAFRQRFGRESEYAAAGYDAVRLVLDGWAEGKRTRADLRAWLSEVRGYEGASGRISFPPGRRANSEMQLLQIDAAGIARPIGLPEPSDWSLPEVAAPAGPPEPVAPQ